MNGYGLSGSPPAAARDLNWRPYTLGHWVFTDQGWTWASDEPFGWITYHYGRWMRTRNLGWVWTPGDQWAPGWVSWRYGNDFVGWAPLPPEAQFNGANGIQQWADQQYNLGATDYTFVPASEFGDDNMEPDEVPLADNGPIFDDSNNVTNIYYDSGVIGVVCLGPNFDFLRVKARHPLGQFRLHRVGFNTAGVIHGAFVSGNTLQIPAPRVTVGRTLPAPREVRGHVTDTRVVNSGAPGAITPRGSTEPPVSQHPVSSGGGQAPANPPSAMRPPSQLNPQPGLNPQPTAIRVPSQMKPVPASPDTEARKAHDLQIIQQNQAAQQARDDADRAAAEQAAAQKHADEAARVERQQAAAAAAHEAEAARQAESARQAARQAQAAQVNQPSGRASSSGNSPANSSSVQGQGQARYGTERSSTPLGIANFCS